MEFAEKKRKMRAITPIRRKLYINLAVLAVFSNKTKLARTRLMTKQKYQMCKSQIC